VRPPSDPSSTAHAGPSKAATGGRETTSKESTTGKLDATKGRPGAPKGNVNRAVDPKFTLAMREAQRVARRNRRRRHAGHLAEARAIVAECGLADSPLAETVAVRVAQIESEIDELGMIVERVGRTKRDGSLNPAYERRLNLIATDRVELRQLLDRLIELKASTPGANREHVVFRMRLPGVLDDPDAVACDKCGALWTELSAGCTGGAVPMVERAPRQAAQTSMAMDSVTPDLDRPSATPQAAAPATVPPRLPEGPVETPAPVVDAPVARRQEPPAELAIDPDVAALKLAAASIESHPLSCRCAKCGPTGFTRNHGWN